MAGSLFTVEYFSCPNCALPYTATKEQHPTKHSGSFHCEVCGGKVHVWSGNYDFFDWQVDKAERPEFGKRWARLALTSSSTEPGNASPEELDAAQEEIQERVREQAR